MGLGLSLAKSLCENTLEGYIQAQNEDDETSFTIGFPMSSIHLT